MLQRKIHALLAKMSIGCCLPQAQSQLREDLGFDSLRMVELIVALEEEFGIQFCEDDLDPAQLLTVEDLYVLTEKYWRAA